MGFFDFLGKVGCATLFHDWSEWEYVTSGACRQTSHCKRSGCDKMREQVAHVWNEWAHCGPGVCDEVRSCRRCEVVEQEERHLWDVWKYDAPTSCVQVRFCRKCDHEGQVREPKSWEDHDLRFEDLPKVKCWLRLGVCPRCNELVKIDLKIRDHDWGPWQGMSGQRTRTCIHCKTTEKG